MIKNIIFDLGGVLITIDQQEAVRRFRELGLADAEERLNPYTQSGIFGDLEIGKISAEQFRSSLSELVGHPLTVEDCTHAWLGYHKELPTRNIKMLQQLRAEGYRLLLLSNTNPFMQSWVESGNYADGHPLSFYFDALYRSYEVKMMKPDKAFFQYVLDNEHIRPEETLFVDDGPRNCAAASMLGIKAFCPINGSDWTQEIRQYLDKPTA
ncbi:MAG: HAD family phosphatase [Prevotella sp.]|nr:HAD family phosphatase [Prevotella sp.]